jgi:hypothetical protein
LFEIQDGPQTSKIFPLVDLFKKEFQKSPADGVAANAPRVHRKAHHVRCHGRQQSPQRFQVAQLGVEVQQRGVGDDVGLKGILQGKCRVLPAKTGEPRIMEIEHGFHIHVYINPYEKRGDHVL